MNVVVTGGAGFIGAHIVDALAERGNLVVAVDDESGGDFQNVYASSVLRRRLDCGNFAAMKELYLKHGIDTVVHCAANAREGTSAFQPDAVTRRNMGAYAATLSAAIAAGVKNVVLFSSMAVYGDQKPPFEEATPPKPVDVYGLNKASMEAMTAQLSGLHGINYVVIRPHNVFGERQSLSDKHRNVVAIFMNRIMRGEPLFIYGDGEQKRAFSYIADSLPCFIAATERCARLHNEIINVGSTEHLTVNQLADAVCEEMGVPSYPRDHLPERPLEVKTAFPTYTKSEKLLDYAESVGWKEGIRRMAAWAKAQGPQKWRNSDPLEIITEKTPKPWIMELE
ncbi:MAG: NAD(P)-dependent oxidoreductase [Candidatus Hydrogenedentes bacterium]|nr:NAD(P)-dependent oxidoreductase [Candidatus Hydrogenedentota bacterium]